MLPEQRLSTRSLILQLLKTEGSRRVGELAATLGLTEMAVRRHLRTLESEGLVRSVSIRQAMGRPTFRYSLTGEADGYFPKKYSQLTLDLLSELEELPGGESVIGSMFEGRRDKLESRYRERLGDRSLGERVAELAAIQNGGGYMAVCERDRDDAYLLHEYNCPISQIASKYRQACQCEEQLFEKLLGANVERTSCIADGDRRCTYAITARAK